MTLLKVTFDGEAPSYQLVSYAEVLGWKRWSDRERELLHFVTTGEARRFSTSKDGIYCDVEMPDAQHTALINALNERDLFINPQSLMQAADEIDCGGSCDHLWHEYDTNASGCKRSENGEYCPNDIAETLRALAKVAESYFPTEQSQ